MPVETSRTKALEVAQRLARPTGDVSETLRADALIFFGKVPEPPVYRRRDDPIRGQAAALIDEGERLLARAYQTSDEAWTSAIDAHLVVLHLLAEGKVEQADEKWADAQRAESAAVGRRKLFSHSDDVPPAVFDPATRQSRFDPRPDRTVTAKVPCPACRKVSELTFSPRLSKHAFQCTHCATQFDAYFAEVRSCEVRRTKSSRTYAFRLKELSGPLTRIDVEDRSVGELQIARTDLIGFLYSPRSVLRGVLNLSSSRVLWVTPGGPCFVATVAFGEDAPELDTLRRFRDGVLSRSLPGRAFIASYYAAGPSLAKLVLAVPSLRNAVRRALVRVVTALE